ncbi:major facilitator superfamily domain-containing protein [Syncephalastrum racemosum]|uniref:Major facilitator superfamily domain-containing protein n=1 Tax=Syncephalastrum racemosum TaxID=13706 RepID=A0A1X2H1T7_SYNRA|nr:major facilitator superfamily domain-containing protein [Syncephalastrum racemosum]
MPSTPSLSKASSTHAGGVFSEDVEKQESLHEQPSAAVEPNASEQEQPPHHKWARALTFVSLQLSLFLAALDNTIMATALPTIGSEFQSMGIASWAVNSYILTLDAFQPLFPKFSDIFGRRNVLIVGIVIFLIGSILCAVSKTMIMLIVCRAIQGIGGAGIFSMVFVIISDLVPLAKRGIYQALLNAVFALASVFGPLIGGCFTEYVTWRWNFYINLPIGGIALVVLVFFMKLPNDKQHRGSLADKLRRIDYLGNICVLGAAVLLLVALNLGGQAYPWSSAAVIAPLVFSGVLACCLVLVETKVAKEPLFPPRLFRIRTVVSVLVASVFFGMTFNATVFYLPYYFQIVRGDTPMWSGIRLIPMQLVISAMSTIAGVVITKTGVYRPFVILGVAGLTLGVGLYSLFDMTTSWSMVYGLTVLAGAGIGSYFSSNLITIQSGVEPRDIAVSVGANNFAELLGGAIGVAIASAVVNSNLKSQVQLVVPEEYAEAISESPEYIRDGLPSQYLQPVLDIYLYSLRWVWYILIIMAGLGFIATLFIQHKSLKKRSRPPSIVSYHSVVASSLCVDEEGEKDDAQGENEACEERPGGAERVSTAKGASSDTTTRAPTTTAASSISTAV